MQGKRKRSLIWMGFIGLLLVVLGAKYLPLTLAIISQQTAVIEKPVILYFYEADPCECMLELTGQAEEQMANWPPENRGNIPVVRIPIDQRPDLEAKYKVFRAPCLVLVDSQDQIAWRQDYPLIAGGPFKLDELEALIAANKLE